MTWLVDGAELGRAASPHTLRWTLAPGVHRIVAEGGGIRSRPVRITVLGG